MGLAVEALIAPMNLLLLTLGWLIHLLMTLAEESKNHGAPVHLLRWVRSHPYKVSLSVCLSIAAFILSHYVGQLNEFMAFMCGYGGDSLMKKFSNMVEVRDVRAD